MGGTTLRSIAMDPGELHSEVELLQGSFLSSEPFINDKRDMTAFLEMLSFLTGRSHLHLYISITNNAILRVG